MNDSILELTHVSKTYTGADGAVTALEDVCLELQSGDFMAVQGPSGCGKTTMLLTAGGLLAPDRGSVKLVNQEPYAYAPDRRACLRAEEIGFVFQRFHLVNYLSVLDNVLVPSMTIRTPDAKARALELLERFQLTKRAGHVPSELSVGEQQRTALARALLNRPRLLLADEPTGNLDRENAKIVLQALKTFADEGGAVLLVTHDENAAQTANRRMNMDSGRLINPDETH